MEPEASLDTNGATIPPSQPNDKNSTLYYYQNPHTGDVSNTPLSLAQLVKLLVPVREGMNPILSPQTQCLPLQLQRQPGEALTNAMSGTPSSVPPSHAQPQHAFGTWTPVSSIDVLREAACQQWYVTGHAEKGQTKGPLTCRGLLEVVTAAGASTGGSSPPLLVYAPNMTPEWTSLEKLEHLQSVLDALKPAAARQIDSFGGEHDTATSGTGQGTKITNTDVTTTSQSQKETTAASEDDIQAQLEAFLTSNTENDNNMDNGGSSHPGDDDDDHSFESDGGTRYVKDPMSDRWIHEALAPSATAPVSTAPSTKAISGTHVKTNASLAANSKPKKKKAQFAKRNARQWVYVTGLPTKGPPVTVQDLHKMFGKAGLLDLDPKTLQPKIKLYQHADGTLKGDASICYARPESVDLAIQILDESLWDQHHTIRVERAKFEAKPADAATSADLSNKRKRNVSQAQRKVARLALRQAQDEGFGERLAGGLKGLRIVVVKHMLDGVEEAKWEEAIQGYCDELGAAVEKITCISKTKVVIVKFVEPTAASDAVEAWNGKMNEVANVSMKALYWDGVTDYTDSANVNPEEEEKRHDDFGKWLDEQGEDQLPPELRLQVAKED
eukprot:Nitzschia sp. Nitz4//scaffold85_size83877//21723//23558//NITZ4_005222-RA/size83877-processed-gene-0.137-mRNA-1//-1//CDS//3329559116//8070//frame0